jgi:DUF4097 and DUF4098 domain-containing protein YvlB
MTLSHTLRYTVAAMLIAAPLAAQVTPPTPPTPPTPSAPPSPPRSHWHSDDEDERADRTDVERQIREATREAAQDAREAAREAAQEAREAVAEALPQAMEAQRDAMREIGPAMRDMGRTMDRDWHGNHWRDDRDNRDSRDDGDDEITIDTTLAFAATGGVVDLGLISGEITVRGWSRAEARIHATSESGPINFDHTPSRIGLEVHRGGDDCQFDLTIPFGTRVLMRSNSGDLRYLSVKGDIEARTVSGGVDISDTKGSTTIETVSGDIRARNMDGGVRANTISGTVELGSVTGDADISTVSGDVSLLDARSRIVRMESVSGTETYGGIIDPAGRYDFRSHSGDITLRIPGDANAMLSLQTFSGDIDTDFNLTLHTGSGESGHHAGNHIDTTIGKGGGAHLTIETFSGDVRIQRASRASE